MTSPASVPLASWHKHAASKAQNNIGRNVRSWHETSAIRNMPKRGDGRIMLALIMAMRTSMYLCFMHCNNGIVKRVTASRLPLQRSNHGKLAA